MKTIYILIGPPSVGKSTWVKNNFENPNTISRDDIVDQVAKEYGLTYDDMFIRPDSSKSVGDFDDKYGEVIQSGDWITYDKIESGNRKIDSLLIKKMRDSVNYETIIVDMTHLNCKSRKNSLKIVKGLDYRKVAVLFNFKGYEDLIKKVSNLRSLELKKIGKYKTISDDVFNRMFSSYQEPSLSEGFDEIIEVDNGKILHTLCGNL